MLLQAGLIGGLTSGAVYALVALGFTIVFAATGVINFAQGDFYMLGGMLSAAALRVFGVPLVFAVLGGVLATTAVGVVFELLAIRPKRDANPLALIIITIGGSILIQSLTRHALGGEELALPDFTPGPSIAFAGLTVARQTLWLWAITALAVVALTYLYRRTRFGRAMRACALDREGARLVGIDTARMVTASFALAALLGALAGAAWAPQSPPAFTVGSSIGLKGFAAAVLGGLGNPIAAVVGGLLLGLIEKMAVAYVPATYQDAIPLMVLLGVLVLRPQGVLGGRAREKV